MRTRRRSFGGPLLELGPLEEEEEEEEMVAKEKASSRELRQAKLELEISERARGMLQAELAASRDRVAELEAAASEALRRIDALELDAAQAHRRLAEFEGLEPAIVPPSPYVVTKLPTFCGRLGGREDPVASQLEGHGEDLGRLGSHDTVFAAPRGSPPDFFWEALREGLDDASPDVDATATAHAMALASRDLPRGTVARLAPWMRAAALCEAEHLARVGANDGLVRFRRYDLSSIRLPSDTVQGSHEEAEAVVLRLVAVREASAPPDDLRALERGLRLLPDRDTRADIPVEVAELRGAAALWADEANALLGEGPSPVRAKLSALVSTVLRFHLRRLLNAPPLPTAKRPNRRPLAPLDENDRRTTRAAAKAKARRDSLTRHDSDDDPENPYHWSRSEVHKLVRLDQLDAACVDGALASQVVCALGQIAAARTPDDDVEGDDADAARARLDAIAPELAAACATRFLDRLLNFPDLQALVSAAGGWGPVERFAKIAQDHADHTVADVFSPCVDLAVLRAQLRLALPDADAARRKLLAELATLARAFGTSSSSSSSKRKGGSPPKARDVAVAAAGLSRMAMLYPDLAPA